ncbi:hypothetical protein [Tissierella creatinophila]|uniref:Uncharacterized protein n=1 Tax=Tissierella creatinophila DSM 6911 TaxID=1123403 RepID=A0A1U7M743_TISCR|nr:hypothetical protein [Tissierella creatinophila]OLS03106.1 hypothetical protein TICRE_08020 [Tissierella creatinophila DSM 6911]
MKRKTITTTLLTAMAFVPSLMDNTKKMSKDAMKASRKSSKMLMNKINGRTTSTMIATGIGGYLLAHAAPIRSLIRER